MGTAVAPNLPQTKPRVPDSLLACLEPERANDLEWKPKGEFQPVVLRQTLGDLRVHMQPASPAQVLEHLMRLQTLTKSREATEQDWTARGAEYQRLLGHYPNDIWAAAIDEWLTNPSEGMWFPSIAELSALMGKRLVERKVMIRRIEWMLQPKEARQDGAKEPRDVRLRTIIKAFKDSALFHKRAVLAEIELAEMENRKPEAWATA